ncbi:MAG: GxxExxY protein [Ignavibacteria bacterium GWA2_55_11]|nr:MAG: GxxExxY protein [Ignavibacteria bacterium GWA2_55_11]OGU47752.1 MAG: GxxExxY protein [Ignavibacteria bacterium GWC2_56_12]OGU64281.1 MAG: GxxExxY protein [Ignavibacteria bacterium RIFCSPHIGHO2_02_FULL_56_12]OGU72604.1 MAG: GxxExxY protein [Ignavibacteria bacterium RIFCSPLOWO2_12_FULL_56_21]OGU74548.1 MAG: GxxExxY protein [Ignavibacteria bacterium RIFCSPLOWO2_02_FULL_55_14]HAV23507.1 GxxExxY protein [Bacteroidota bacterium]
MRENEISGVILDSCIQIHSRLGPGLLESVYEAVLAYELKKRGLHSNRQSPIPVIYEDVRLELGFRADFIVEELVVVELKSVENLLPVHKMQVLTYLRLSGLKLGLLINFNVKLIKDGFVRVVNGL